MAEGKDWQRETNGFRFDFGGMNTVLPPDLLDQTHFPYAANVRRYKQGRITGRARQTAAVLNLGNPVHSIRRLNDSTPAGPPSGFILISGAGGALFAGAALVDGGMSGKPVSLVPFRPNASVQPWMYVADVNKMLKVRSDGTKYRMGIAEPQTAPGVVANVAATIISFLGDVTVYYWGDSPHSGPVGQYIWRNGNDTGSSGPTRSTADAIAAGHVTTGSSLLFDESHTSPAGSPTNPMQWDILDDTGASLGTKSLFEPALESAGYSDFNFVAQCSLYVPAPGTYVFQAAYKDRIMWGIGNGQNGEIPTWSGKGTVRGTTNQSMTAIGGYPLLPAPASNDGVGYTGTSSISVTFPAAGIYPFELDYDYWYHSNRHCTVKVNGVNIPPITGDIFTDAEYRYTYRSSATGATSNPSPASLAITLPVASTDLTPVPSTDPQVDKIDWYRLDDGLENWTYVGTSPNAASPPFTDSLLDTEVSANPLLEFDNYEPFPSIDLPRKGTVNIAAGAISGTIQVTWVSGDQFNVRWLPGTIIVLGTVAYTLYNRPTSSTQLTVILIGDMPTVLAGLVYEIAEPILAAQPMPSMWGPTDNVNFMFACGDPLRPGVLYWTKGNNPDSAPDTNQQDVTSPSEPLLNGCIVGGIGMVFSTERAWLIYPNFFNALATVTGTAGATWSLVESIANRGLYIRRCICTDGGSIAFFRAKDGIYVSPGGNGSQSITDGDLYNLFPHEGFNPQPITLAGYTVYPPDDTKPDAQQLNSANGYVYYDYQDTNGTPRTLVYDIAAKAWCVDQYQFEATTHALEEGPDVNGTLTGNIDGSVRPLGHEEQPAPLPSPFPLPFPTPSGQFVAWALPTISEAHSADAGAVNGHATASPTFGDLGMTGSSGISNWIWAARWYGFVLPPLPAGATIQSIFPVYEGWEWEASGVPFRFNDAADSTLLNPWSISPGGNVFSGPPGPPPSGTSEPTVYPTYFSSDLGNNPAIVGTASIWIRFFETLSMSGDAHFKVFNPRLAIYYTVPPTPPDQGETDTQCVLLTQAVNADDARANKRVGDLFFKGSISSPVAVTPYQTQYTVSVGGYAPTSLAIGAANQKYIIDFTSGLAVDIDDIETVLSWAIGNGTILDLWQPNFLPLPENVQDRPTDFTDCGTPGLKFFQGVICEADSFNLPKVFQIQNGDDLSFVTPNESPCTFNGQSVQAFSFSPFLAHTVRMISTDGVPWRRWTVNYVFQPYPEEATEWSTELFAFAQGWQHLRMLNIPYIASQPVTITLNFDQWPQIVLTDILPATASQLYPTKTKVTVPVNKSKLLGFSFSSMEPFRLFKPMVEALVGEWGRTDSYRLVQPFGGNANTGVEV